MMKAFKYRLTPNNKQKEKLAQTFGCARLLYNSLLAWYNNEYKTSKEQNKQMEQLPLVTFFKKQYTFLKDVDSLALMNARRHFETAIKNYFQSKKGQRKGKRVGFPTFKKKGVCKDTYTTNNLNGTVRIHGNKIRLPKIGFVEFNKHRPLPSDARIISCTVVLTKSNRYYVSVMVELPDNQPRKRNFTNPNVVGLDMSLTYFVVDSDNTSDNTKTKYVRQYRKNEKKLKRMQRVLSRRKMVDTGETVFSRKWGKDVPKLERSKNREKARLKLARLHEHIANCRKDFCIKQAIRYSKSYDVVVIEDINMQDMARCLKLGKSVNDLGFGLFKQWLEYKCADEGTLLVKADKWFASSKTCNHCKSKNDLLRLSDREWVCPTCGSVIDRDFNAACNLRDWYFTYAAEILNTVGTTGINACGDNTDTTKTACSVASVVGEAGSPLL